MGRRVKRKKQEQKVQVIDLNKMPAEWVVKFIDKLLKQDISHLPPGD